jgi:histidinol phosphatase-like enzyme
MFAGSYKVNSISIQESVQESIWESIQESQDIHFNSIPFSNQHGLGTQSWCAPFCLIDSTAAGGCVPA